jgi:hypothetical protein
MLAGIRCARHRPRLLFVVDSGMAIAAWPPVTDTSCPDGGRSGERRTVNPLVVSAPYDLLSSSQGRPSAAVLDRQSLSVSLCVSCRQVIVYPASAAQIAAIICTVEELLTGLQLRRLRLHR